MYAEKLMELCQKTQTEKGRNEIVDCINTCFDYLNIQMMASLQISMSDGDVRMIEMYNNRRNHAHDNMCEAMSELNSKAKDKGMDPIFNFELEKMNKNGRFAGYSQDNHYKTAGFAAIMTDELMYLGRKIYKSLDEIERLEKDVIDKVERHELPNLTYDGLIKTLENFDNTHYSLDCIDQCKENEALTLNFRDGDGFIVVSPIDDFTFDVIESSLPKGSDLAEIYLDTDGSGMDVPKSVIKEEIEKHQGFNIGAKINLEMEKTLEDVCAKIKQNLDKENSRDHIENRNIEGPER